MRNRPMAFLWMITLLSTMLIHNGCSNPKFEKKFPTQQLTINAKYTEDGKKHVISYSSMEEAEWKLVTSYLSKDQYDDDAVIGWFDPENLKQILCADKSSMSYPFEVLVRHLPYAKIVDSNDGKIRFYGMEMVQYEFCCYIQYKQGDGVFLYEPENLYGYVDTVYYLNTKDGLCYIPISYNYCGLGVEACVNAYRIADQGLIPMVLFDTENGLTDQMCFSKLYAGADGFFDEKNMILNVIIKDSENSIDSAVFRYVWTGNCFEKEVASFFNKDGDCICLTESHRKGKPSVKAYIKKGISMCETNIFKVGNGYNSEIETVVFDEWRSTNPEEAYFAFNTADNSLYIPLVETNLKGADRYLVYQFDGEHFVYKRQDAGFWLHSSLREFKAFADYGISVDYLIRIDKLADEKYRYASWKVENTMSDKPDLVITGGRLINGRYEFENKGYKYVLDTDEYELRVYQGDLLILNQHLSIRENDDTTD